jgi:hypothetical protein
VKPEPLSTPHRALYCVLSIPLILAAFWSVRLARADYDAAQPDAPSVMRATRLASTSANYWLRSAATLELDHPDDPAVDANLDKALALNPRFTEAWLARAVRAEIRWRLTAAERDYLAAAEIDHMYKPAWALANFYLRQNQAEQFWRYARKCLEIVEPRRLEPASYNPAPVFELAWQVSHNADEIRRRLIPPRHFILVDYLDYLAEHNLADAGSDVAMDLAAYGDPGDNYFLLNFCDRLINQAKGKSAMAIWNAMVDHQTERAERLDPVHGASLTNGDLKRPFERVGFDWRLLRAEGVLENHFPDTGEVRFEFSGDQPEGILLLYQSVPVVPGQAYRFTFRYRTTAMEHAQGLSWQVWDYAGQRLMPMTCKLTPHPEWSEGEAALAIPPGVSIIRLGLVYQRATGSTRIQGTAAFTRFALKLKPALTSEPRPPGSGHPNFRNPMPGGTD